MEKISYVSLTYLHRVNAPNTDECGIGKKYT